MNIVVLKYVFNSVKTMLIRVLINTPKFSAEKFVTLGKYHKNTLCKILADLKNKHRGYFLIF